MAETVLILISGPPNFVRLFQLNLLAIWNQGSLTQCTAQQWQFLGQEQQFV